MTSDRTAQMSEVTPLPPGISRSVSALVRPLIAAAVVDAVDPDAVQIAPLAFM